MSSCPAALTDRVATLADRAPFLQSSKHFSSPAQHVRRNKKELARAARELDYHSSRDDRRGMKLLRDSKQTRKQTFHVGR
jgi:hypothetical protein